MFTLPESRRYRMGRPPLARAVAEVRFPLIAALQTNEGLAGLQPALAEPFPELEILPGSSFQISFGPQAQQPPRFVFKSDSGYDLQVSPTTAILGVGSEYVNREAFADMFRAALMGRASLGVRKRIQRLGVRYINACPADHREWGRWFKSGYVGWVETGIVDAAAQRTTLSITQLAEP